MSQNRKPRIYGLDDYRLTPATLRKLGSRPVHVSVQQRGPALSGLWPFRPAERERRMSKSLQAGFERLRRRWPDAEMTARGSGRLPWTLDATIPASSVSRIAAENNVVHVIVEKIPGLRKRPRPRKPGWFCVWGRVAIQVEERTKGRVDVENRLVLVVATSEDQAKHRLSKEWRRYASPYLNSRGELVRWQLVEVVGVCEILEDELDPRGTEVYSWFTSRRMSRAYVWRPRSKLK